MVNQEIMKKIAQAIVEESAQLDGVQPEEMLREVATSLNGEDGRPYHGVGEVVAHRGVQITEEIVRNITVAVVKEAAELDGVNPEEMVQKVIGALQGQSVTPVAPITNDSAIMKQRGVAVDMDVAKTVTQCRSCTGKACEAKSPDATKVRTGKYRQQKQNPSCPL